MKLLSGLASGLGRILFPPVCANCGRLGHLLCPNCWTELDFFDQSANFQSLAPQLTTLRVLGNYQPPLSTLIKNLKYQQIKPLAQLLGQLLFLFGSWPTDINYVTFVPTSSDRLKWRGYNQTELICREFSRLTKLPIWSGCQKTRATINQAKLTGAARATNLNQAFALKPAASRLITNCHLLIIDDVTTTGATLRELSQLLLAAGASQVSGLVIAHQDQ